MNIYTTFSDIEEIKDSGVYEETPLSFSLSKTKADKAGEVIRCYIKKIQDGKSVSANEKEQFGNALLLLRSYREYHLPHLKTIESLIQSKLNRLNLLDSSIVSSRSKRLESIALKLVHNSKKSMRLSQMEDVVGLRVIFKDIQSLEKFTKDFTLCEIRCCPDIDNDIKQQEYIKKPKPDGYRGIHYIFKYQTVKDKKIRIELQLRTQIQHEWATLIEILGSLRKTSFKTGQGDERHREFLKVVSVLFAMEENRPVVGEYSRFSKPQICSKLKKLDEELQIIKTLERVKSIEPPTDRTQNKYCLLQLDLDNHETSIQYYDDESSANDIYVRLEHLYKDSNRFNVVLVSVSDIKEIEKAYPNYFMDTNNFIKRFNNLLNKYS